MASELEFFLFNEDYPAAAAKGYAGLTPSSSYRIDYHLLQPTQDEPLMRAIRNGMLAAGLPIENSKGEWGRGQHEINMRYAEPLLMADRHTLFKQGAKQLAQEHGKSITFMAKPFRGEAGSSCHIHLSLRRGDGNAFCDPRTGERDSALPALPRRAHEILARALPLLRAEHQLLQALRVDELGAHAPGVVHR